MVWESNKYCPSCNSSINEYPCYNCGYFDKDKNREDIKDMVEKTLIQDIKECTNINI